MTTIRLSQSEVYETLSLSGDALSKFLSSPNGMEKYLAAEQVKKHVAEVDGRHYVTYVQDVKSLVKEKRFNEAEELLVKIVDAVCREFDVGGRSWSAPTWYHEKLSSVQKRLGKLRESEETMRKYADLMDRFNALNKKP